LSSVFFKIVFSFYSPKSDDLPGLVAVWHDFFNSVLSPTLWSLLQAYFRNELQGLRKEMLKEVFFSKNDKKIRPEEQLLLRLEDGRIEPFSIATNPRQLVLYVMYQISRFR
jgi:hypothetical protein